MYLGDLHCSYATATLKVLLVYGPDRRDLVPGPAVCPGRNWILPIHSCCRVLQYLLSAHCWSGGTESIPRYVVVHENEKEAVVT